MSDKINENEIDAGLSRLLSLAGLKPTLIVMPAKEVQPTEEEVEDEIETDAEMQHSDAKVIDPNAFVPSRKATRKMKWVPSKQGDNPLDEKAIEERAVSLQNEYTEFKNDK